MTDALPLPAWQASKTPAPLAQVRPSHLPLHPRASTQPVLQVLQYSSHRHSGQISTIPNTDSGSHSWQQATNVHVHTNRVHPHYDRPLLKAVSQHPLGHMIDVQLQMQLVQVLLSSRSESTRCSVARQYTVARQQGALQYSRAP
jgi:hypothetical protein